MATPIGSEGMGLLETSAKFDDDLQKGLRLALTFGSSRVSSRDAKEVSRPLEWGGLIAFNEDEVIRHAVALYQNRYILPLPRTKVSFLISLLVNYGSKLPFAVKRS